MKSILYVPRKFDTIFNISLIEIDGWLKIMPAVLAEGLPKDAPTLSLVPDPFLEEFDIVARFRHPEKISNSDRGKTLQSGLVTYIPEENFDKYASLCTKWNASTETPETWRKAVEFAKKVIA